MTVQALSPSEVLSLGSASGPTREKALIDLWREASAEAAKKDPERKRVAQDPLRLAKRCVSETKHIKVGRIALFVLGLILSGGSEIAFYYLPEETPREDWALFWGGVALIAAVSGVGMLLVSIVNMGRRGPQNEWFTSDGGFGYDLAFICKMLDKTPFPREISLPETEEDYKASLRRTADHILVGLAARVRATEADGLRKYMERVFEGNADVPSEGLERREFKVAFTLFRKFGLARSGGWGWYFTALLPRD